MPPNSWLAASHSCGRAEPWGQQELGDFLTPEVRIYLHDKEGLLGQSNPHQMLRSTGAKRLHRTRKEGFIHLHLPEAEKDLPRGAQSFKVLPCPLSTLLAAPTVQGAPGHNSFSPGSFKAKETQHCWVVGRGMHVLLQLHNCRCRTCPQPGPIMWPKSSTTPTPFLSEHSFISVTKAQQSMGDKAKIWNFAERPGFTLTLQVLDSH